MIGLLIAGVIVSLLIAGADMLRDWLGLPVVLMREAGLILALYVALVAVVATRPSVSTPAVWAIIVTNGLWALASFAILATGLGLFKSTDPILGVGGGLLLRGGPVVADVGYRYKQVVGADSFASLLSVGQTMRTHQVRFGIGVRF